MHEAQRLIRLTMNDEFPAVFPHGDLQEVFENIYLVTGSLRMKGKVPFSFSRNMTVLRQGDELILVNSLRLDESTLDKLDALGRVAHVIRLAGFHGMDDPFYKERYGAQVWAVKGQVYARGYRQDADPNRAYFRPDHEVDEQSKLPVEGAQLYRFDGSNPPEGALLVPREGGILITGDSLQNWARSDQYFNLPARIFMKLMGFVKACNVGPGWVKMAKPSIAGVKGLLDLEFEHVLPAHGGAVAGDAKKLFRPAIERLGRTV